VEIFKLPSKKWQLFVFIVSILVIFAIKKVKYIYINYIFVSKNPQNISTNTNLGYS